MTRTTQPPTPRGEAAATDTGQQLAQQRALRTLIAIAASRGHWDTACKLVDQLVRWAADGTSAHALGVALRMRGELLSDRGFIATAALPDPLTAALASFDAAVAAFEELGDRVEVGWTLRSVARGLIDHGDKRRAIEHVESAKRLFAH